MFAVLVDMDGSNGRHLLLSDISGTPDDLRYSATLATETGECSVRVWEDNSGLASFVRSLATDWAGFDGEREYASIEGS